VVLSTAKQCLLLANSASYFLMPSRAPQMDFRIRLGSRDRSSQCHRMPSSVILSGHKQVMQASRSKERFDACSNYVETETLTPDHSCGRSTSNIAVKVGHIACDLAIEKLIADTHLPSQPHEKDSDSSLSGRPERRPGSISSIASK
jgi:hypothetical protein